MAMFVCVCVGERCDHCQAEKVETEEHFLLRCVKYEEDRSFSLNNIKTSQILNFLTIMKTWPYF